MDNGERIQLLNEAGDLISQAIENIKQALRGTPEYNHASAYIIPHLQTWIGNGNPYDKSVYSYIDNLENQDDEEYEEEEE